MCPAKVESASGSCQTPAGKQSSLPDATLLTTNHIHLFRLRASDPPLYT